LEYSLGDEPPDALPKHQTTALMLLHTEVIGLNASIHRIFSRVVTAVGMQRLSFLLHCPKYEQQRAGLIKATGSEDLRSILTHVASAQAATW
jgi:hypothetical protein